MIVGKKFSREFGFGKEKKEGDVRIVRLVNFIWGKGQGIFGLLEISKK